MKHETEEEYQGFSHNSRGGGGAGLPPRGGGGGGADIKMFLVFKV